MVKLAIYSLMAAFPEVLLYLHYKPTSKIVIKETRIFHIKFAYWLFLIVKMITIIADLIKIKEILVLPVLMIMVIGNIIAIYVSFVKDIKAILPFAFILDIILLLCAILRYITN